MITRPTVFILGAGASQLNGFPLGGALANSVVTELETPFHPVRVHADVAGYDAARADATGGQRPPGGSGRAGASARTSLRVDMSTRVSQVLDCG